MPQHLVSVIELLGLVIGLLGFFYLSLSGGMFGKRGPSLIRPILPGLAFALSIELVRNTVPPLGFTDDPRTLSVQSLAVRTLWSFALGYFTAFLSQREFNSKQKFFKLFVSYNVVGIVSGAADLIWQYVRGGERVPLSISVLLHAIAFLVGAVVLLDVILIIGPVLLNERVMKNIGIIATILAILAQFLPPMLDLLNIPITKP